MRYSNSLGKSRAQAVRQYLAALVGIIGCLVVIGWLIKNHWMVQINPEWVPMQYKTAIGFVLSGLALSLFYLNIRVACMVAAAGTLLLAGAALFQHFLQVGDYPFLAVHDFTGQPSSRPGMGRNTAIAFILVAASILGLARFPSCRWIKVAVTVAAAVILALGSITFLAYLTGLPPMFGLGGHTAVAVHTAVGFICLSLSLLWYTRGTASDERQYHRWLFAAGVPLLLTVTLSLERALVAEKEAAIQESLRRETASIANQLSESMDVIAAAFDRMGDRWLDAEHTSREDWLADAEAHARDFAAIAAIEWIAPEFQSRWRQPAHFPSLTEVPGSGHGSRLHAYFKEISTTNRSQYSPVFAADRGHTVLLIYSLNDRSRDLGWLAATVNLTELLQPVVARMEELGLSGRLLHDKNGAIALNSDVEVAENAVQVLTYLTVPGQNWMLAVQPATSFDVLYQTPLHRLLTSLMLVIVALSAWVFLQFIRLRTQQNRLEVFESLSDAVLVTSEKGVIEAVNRAALAMFKTDRSSLLGSSLRRLLPETLPQPEVYQSRQDQAAQADNDEVFERMLTAFDSQGRSFPVDVTTSVRQLSRGLRTIHVVRDLTEKLRLERMLNEKSALLDTAVNASAVGFATQDRGGRIIQVNDALCSWLGYAPFELLGKALGSFVVDAEHAAIEGSLQGFASGTTQPVRREVRCLTKQGHLVWGLLSAAPIFDSAGNLLLVTVQIIDMEHEKQLALELENKNAELQEKNEELDQFAYIASHDLKEPLRTLRAYSSYLIKDLQKNDHKRVRQDAQFIEDAASRMTRLIDDLLQFSRVLNTDFKFRKISLADALQFAVDQLKLAIAENQAQIVVPEALPSVRGDHTQLARVFLNLLGNAIKFRRADVSPVITITSQYISESGRHRISVSDNGIGISGEHTTDIFKPFKRLHSYAEYEGNGIGLAMVKKIIDRHGGNIKVEPNAGPGVCFIFELPASNTGK